MMVADGMPETIAYGRGMAVMLVACADAPDRLSIAVAALGGRIAARLGWSGPLLPSAAPHVVAVEAADVDIDTLVDRLPALADWATTLEAVLVIAMAPDQIDAVASVALGRHVVLLVDPTVTACVGTLAVAAEQARVPVGVSDVGRDSDSVRLERLNEEVARIAQALARLTRADSEGLPTVADRTMGYGASPIMPELTSAFVPSAVDIRRMIRARRMRDQFFEPALFEDPGWDMLLDLYAAELERVHVSVSSLCIAAAVAPTTALRWIARMTEAGLFERHPDPHDRRRVFLALSARASDAMRRYMTALQRNGMPVA